VQFLYLDASRQVCGPCSREELDRLLGAGEIQLATPVRQVGQQEWIPFGRFLSPTAIPTNQPPPLPNDEPAVDPKTREQNDWRALKRHILVPWNEVRDMRWLDNRRLMGVAAIGLFPLLIIALFTNSGRIEGAYWAMAFYFSALWGVFFYYVFPAPGVTIRNCLICFFGTGLFSVSLLQVLYFLINLTVAGVLLDDPAADPRRAIETLTLHPNGLTRWAAWVLCVGLPEELCKVLALIYLARNYAPFQPQTMLYYGLMAGLGFGIYEGVAYQQRINFDISRAVGEYYILNVVRLTALPFIHAIWTAIAGYFIGFAYQYPERKRGLLIIAVALPAFLHGTYNAVTLTSVLSSLGVALISVFALNLYLAKSRDFERVLQGR
jgi:protease PrsW